MRKLLPALLLAALPAFAQYSPSGSPAPGNAGVFQPLAKTSYLAASTTSASIALGAAAVPTTVVITGTAGQFSCSTCSALAIGMQLTISGTEGGTGSISGYTNPTTYLVSAVGSGTFALSQTNGAAIVTTTGTPTGLTYTANAAVSQQQVQIFNSTAAIAFVIFCSSSSCTASAGTSGASSSDYPVAAASAEVVTVPQGTTYAAAILASSSGAVYFTPGIGGRQ